MSDTSTDKAGEVFGIGNAIVDILAFVNEDFIREHALEIGSMTLMDAEKQASLLRGLQDVDLQLKSGGSAANTMVALAQSGGRGFYSGKVARDTHGEFYRQDLLEAGIHFDVHPAPEQGQPTGTCLVLTTPDAERTMCTHLGVSTTLSPADVDADRLAQCAFSYIEGYLWDAEQPRQACIETMEQSKRHKIPVALTFSDPWLLDRFAEDFLRLAREYCHIVFCNADEIARLYEGENLTDRAKQLGQVVPLCFVTDGPQGCWVVEQGVPTHVPGFPVDPVDTVGAGDAFAGGVLAGLSRGIAPQQAARWGNYLASKVVQMHSPRLEEAPVEACRRMLSGCGTA